MAGELGTITSMGNSAVSLIILIIAVGILVTIVVVTVLAILQARRYKQFRVVIWQKDGFGQYIQKHDEGGVFVDGKTKNKRLFLRNAAVGLEPDNIPYVSTGKGNKYIYLLQTGLKNFRYLKPNISTDFINFTVGEEDINWALNSYEANKKRFNTSWLAQYMPFIILAFCMIIMLVMFIYIFNKIAMIKDIAMEMQKVAELLAQASTGTTVIQ